MVNWAYRRAKPIFLPDPPSQRLLPSPSSHLDPTNSLPRDLNEPKVCRRRHAFALFIPVDTSQRRYSRRLAALVTSHPSHDHVDQDACRSRGLIVTNASSGRWPPPTRTSAVAGGRPTPDGDYPLVTKVSTNLFLTTLFWTNSVLVPNYSKEQEQKENLTRIFFSGR